MGKRLLLDVAPTGVQHEVEVDEDGFFYVEHTPSAVEQEIIDNCSKLRGLHQNARSAFKFAGQVPINTHAAWKKEWREKYSDTWTWPTFLGMKMNSRENSKLNILDQALPTTHNRRMV